MADTTTGPGKARPYRPSWIDRFNIWVAMRSKRTWVFYIGFGFVLIVIQLLVLWLEGGLPAQELMPVIIFNALFTPFLLGLNYLLDNLAVAALDSMRPVLGTTDSEFERCKYQLANMPSWLPLAAGLIGLVVVILMEWLGTVPVRYAALEELPVFSIVFQITDKSSAFLFGVFIYHTIRQLRLVTSINSQYVRVKLFHLGPLQGFSRLTATTAVGLVVGVYGWMLINPELWADPVILGFAVLITLLAAAVFAGPLYGVHRRIVVAKEKALQEIDLQFEAALDKFKQSLQAEDHAAIEMLNGTIASLEIQHRKVSAIPAWPWSPETARFALTAIALPLILAFLQYLLERAFIG